MSNSKQSILSGVDNIIDETLGFKDIGKRPFYKHKTSCQKLCKSAIPVNIGVLLEQIYMKIILNWEKATYHQLSAENWRFTKQSKLVRTMIKKWRSKERL